MLYPQIVSCTERRAEFINEIYIGSSSKKDKHTKGSIEFVKPKQILSEKWGKVDLILFVGSIGASIRLITSLLSFKDKDPGVIVIDSKGKIKLSRFRNYAIDYDEP